jgi:hypothetical protein
VRLRGWVAAFPKGSGPQRSLVGSIGHHTGSPVSSGTESLESISVSGTLTHTIGDGLGFDILSFDDADDSEQMLEVKATVLGKFFPFYGTANEVRCSDDITVSYHMFRMLDIGREPQIYTLHGSLKILCQLEPVLFRAVI